MDSCELKYGLLLTVQIAMRAKVAAQAKAEEAKRRIESGEVVKESGALARFG
jgi:U3 small nucleolar RNA-associated protein 7